MADAETGEENAAARLMIGCCPPRKQCSINYEVKKDGAKVSNKQLTRPKRKVAEAVGTRNKDERAANECCGDYEGPI